MNKNIKVIITSFIMIFCILTSSISIYAAENTFSDRSEIANLEYSDFNSNAISPKLNISPEELHTFNRSYLKGIVTASDMALYADLWAIIPTTSGLISVYSNATVPGASSYYVRLLQACLDHLDYNVGTIDGIYGPNTESAIRKFQSNNGLAVDGIAGQATWRCMDTVIDQYFEGLGRVEF